MPRVSHPDPILAAIETAQAPRAVIIRTLARWNGWASTAELLETYVAIVGDDNALARNALDKALSRLVRQGKVLRVATVGDRFDGRGRRYLRASRYRLAVAIREALAPRGRGPRVCPLCGKVGALARGHAAGHLPDGVRRPKRAA